MPSLGNPANPLVVLRLAVGLKNGSLPNGSNATNADELKKGVLKPAPNRWCSLKRLSVPNPKAGLPNGLKKPGWACGEDGIELEPEAEFEGIRPVESYSCLAEYG